MASLALAQCASTRLAPQARVVPQHALERDALTRQSLLPPSAPPGKILVARIACLARPCPALATARLSERR